MSTDPFSGAGPEGGQEPSEEQLRAAYEAELSRITATDMIAQAAVSLLNIAARRLGPPPGAELAAGAPDGRDLVQVRDAIDAVRALLEILARTIPAEVVPLREALSQLQMAYASQVGAGEPAAGAPPAPAEPAGGPATSAEPSAGEQPGEPGPGPAQTSGRLWVPGS